MKVFNLMQYGALKAEKYINASCGGKYTRKEAYHIGGIGIGRLRYQSGISTIDDLGTEERFRANLENYQEGLGMYVRSLSFNYLLAIPRAEIMAITITKEEDELRSADFSWTGKLMNLGMPYHYARVMLLEHEIATLHDTLLTITTVDGQYVFTVKRNNPAKLIHFFEAGPWADIFTHKILGYRHL